MIFDAIRACNRRIDSQKIAMDDIYARIRTQDWYHDISDQEEDEEIENQFGVENRSSGRRRLRNQPPHRRTLRQWTRPVQFRSNLRRDALELALSVKRIEQDLQHQFQATARLKESVHNDVQKRVKVLKRKCAT